MIVRASRKARKAGLEVLFKNALAEALPFPDAHFDAVLTTLMLHHLPRKARQQCAREIRRVLKPRGRVLAVDFATAARERRRGVGHFHRHGHVDIGEIIRPLAARDERTPPTADTHVEVKHLGLPGVLLGQR
jgi:ubiquinone/menaquinone biosynthesis C-methylase UbiE